MITELKRIKEIAKNGKREIERLHKIAKYRNISRSRYNRYNKVYPFVLSILRKNPQTIAQLKQELRAQLKDNYIACPLSINTHLLAKFRQYLKAFNLSLIYSNQRYSIPN